MKNYLFILFVAMLVLASCGSRKTNKSKTKDESKSKIELQTDVKISENSKVENDISENNSATTESKSEEKENHMKPVDPNRPMKKTETVNGNTKTITWENAEVIEKSKKEDSKKTENSKLTDKTVLTSGSTFEFSAELKQTDEKSSESLNKRTDAQRGFNPWWLFLLIVPAGAYFYWKFKKQKAQL